MIFREHPCVVRVVLVLTAFGEEEVREHPCVVRVVLVLTTLWDCAGDRQQVRPNMLPCAAIRQGVQPNMMPCAVN